ncbi:MAG: sugar ABC transporter permease [Firmicutes bacterium]|nr:sugar ABC transporter permease [Bacillota bacterium]
MSSILQWYRRHERAVVGYLFLAPDVIGLLIFVIGPMIYAFYLSLHEWSGFGPTNYVGWGNYRDLLVDSRFWGSLRTTLYYVVLYVPSLFISSLALAVLVNRRLPALGFFKTTYFIPVVTSMVVVSIVWGYMFESSYGFLNYLLRCAGLESRRWIGSAKEAMPSVVLVSTWKAIGYYMVIFLAGLQDIPQEYYDAAKVDGASAWQSFANVTWPLLKPTSFFVIVIIVISSFQVFDQIYVMTRGGPAYATYVILMYIYESGFRFMKLGYASALAFVLFGIIFALTLIQAKYLRSGRID